MVLPHSLKIVARAERTSCKASGLSMIDQATAEVAAGGVRGKGASFIPLPFFVGAMAVRRRKNSSRIGGGGWSSRKKEREEERPRGEFSLRFPLMHFHASYQEEKLSYSGKVLFFTIFEGGKE